MHNISILGNVARQGFGIVALLCFLSFFFFFFFLTCCIFSGHINNLYNTTFWTLVQKGGLTTTQAEERLNVFSNNIYVLIFSPH